MRCGLMAVLRGGYLRSISDDEDPTYCSGGGPCSGERQAEWLGVKSHPVSGWGRTV